MPSLLEHMRRWENRDPEVRAERAEQKRKEEQSKEAFHQAVINDTIRLSSELLQAEKKEIEAGRPDPSFVLPESAAALKMSFRQAKEFARAESEKFVAGNPDYFVCRENFEKITNYLTVNSVVIPNAETFTVAFERLRSLGLLIQKPAEPEPEKTFRLEGLDENNSQSIQSAIDLLSTMSSPDAAGEIERLKALPAYDPRPASEAAERERKRAYFEDAIYTDPDKPDQKMTAHQLSKCDAETYRRVMRIPRSPNIYSPRDGATHR